MLNGSVEQQVSDIYTYLFRLAQTLNLEFEKTTPAAIFEEVNKALEGADTGLETNKAIADNYQQLKALVIKTADYTAGTGNSKIEEYYGTFVAKSDFGEYVEETNAAITTNSTGIEQMYEYSASLGILGNGESDVDITEIETWTQAYIKSGLIYYDGATPKYGIAVGDVGTLITVNDTPVVDRQNLLATFTSDRMSFWKGGIEIAYLSGSSMYFPSANITGGSIDINSAFTVTSAGVMNATGANVSGTITATDGAIGNWTIGTAIYNGKTSISDTSNAGIYIGTDGLYLGDAESNETYVKLLRNGTLTANSATITGTLHAGDNSTIGDWSVKKTTQTLGTTTNVTIVGRGNSSRSYVQFGSSTTKYYASSTQTVNRGTTIKLTVGAASGYSGSITVNGETQTSPYTWTIPNNADSIRIELSYDYFAGTIVATTTEEQPLTVSSIYSGSRSSFGSTNAGVYIGSDGISIGSPLSSSAGAVGFQITSSGALTCRGATFNGTINATSGKIGDWDIGYGGISSGGKEYYNDTVNGLFIGTSGIGIRGSANSYCTISSAGKLTCTGASISGAITASSLTISNGATISGTISASNIKLGGLMAVYESASSTIVGGHIGYTTGATIGGNTTVGVSMQYSTNYGFAATSSGVGMHSKYGEVFCDGLGVKMRSTYSNSGTLSFEYGNAFFPYIGTVNLGTSNYKWDNVYANSGPWSGSDRNNKKDISYSIDDYLDVFDRLQPVSYKFKDGTSGRTHIGFIAQDVEDAILDSGMTTQDYACISIAPKRDEEGNVIEGYDYSLRYEEFIALAIYKIKKLEARIAALEGA